MQGLRVVALSLVLRGPLALFLRHLLGAVGALGRHACLLLVHALLLHGAVAGHLARGLLPAAEQFVEPTHGWPPCRVYGAVSPKPAPETPDPDNLSALR